MILTMEIPILAHDFEVDGIYYYILNSADKTVVVTYKGDSYIDYNDEYTGDIIIPSLVTYNDEIFTVTAIGDYAFYDCSKITSVIMPNTTTEIGYAAFYGCKCLSSIKIPNSMVEIHPRVFEECIGITEVSIPISIKGIGWSAFKNCSGLKNVYYNATKCLTMKDAFSDCVNLKTVTIGNAVKIISAEAILLLLSAAV